MKTNNSHKSFTELLAWQEARILKTQMRQLTEQFPIEEKFRLTDQIIRSSRSVGSNIAEGHGRFTFKDQLHFCIQARGSLSETHNHLIDALDCAFINETIFEDYLKQIKKVEQLLNGYITYLKKGIITQNVSTYELINLQTPLYITNRRHSPDQRASPE